MKKILILLALWLGVCWLAVIQYQRMFPDLRPSRPTPAARSGDPEIVAFAAGSPPWWTKVTTRMSKAAGAQPKTARYREQATKSFIIVMKGYELASAYSQLVGLPGRNVTQLPRDQKRWDILARSPKDAGDKPGDSAAFGKEVAEKVLANLNWKAKTVSWATTGFRFREKKAGDPEPSAVVEGDVATTASGQTPLGRMLGIVANQVNRKPEGKPVQLVANDAKVMDLKPAGVDADAVIKIPALHDPEKAAQWLCSTYGVTSEAFDGKQERVLLYHPKYTSDAQVAAWEAAQPKQGK